jgi:hypothetical protein
LSIYNLIIIVGATRGLLTLNHSLHAVTKDLNTGESEQEQHQIEAPVHSTPTTRKELQYIIISSSRSLSGKVLDVSKEEHDREEKDERVK